MQTAVVKVPRGGSAGHPPKEEKMSGPGVRGFRGRTSRSSKRRRAHQIPAVKEELRLPADGRLGRPSTPGPGAVESGARVLFVGLGCPKQERRMPRARPSQKSGSEAAGPAFARPVYQGLRACPGKAPGEEGPGSPKIAQRFLGWSSIWAGWCEEGRGDGGACPTGVPDP